LKFTEKVNSNNTAPSIGIIANGRNTVMSLCFAIVCPVFIFCVFFLFVSFCLFFALFVWKLGQYFDDWLIIS